MKMKKFLCGLLTAAMVFTTSNVVNTKRVEAALEDHYDILTTLTGEKEEGKSEIEVTDKDKGIKISVKETGVYNLELESETSETEYYLGNDEGRIITTLSVSFDDMTSDFRQVYFVKGQNYYLINVDDTVDNNFKCKFILGKSNYELEDEFSRNISITAYRVDTLEGNHSFNTEGINDLDDGFKWDKETNTLKFNNYKGNYVFDISYYPLIVADSKDLPDYPVLTIEFNGDNTFENMEANGGYIYPAFMIRNVDVNIVGEGTVNVKPLNYINKDTGATTETSYNFVHSASTVVFDGPTVNIEKVSGNTHAFVGSVLKIKSGEINIESYSAAELKSSNPNLGGVAYYGPVLVANNLSLEGGSIFIKAEEYKGENTLAKNGMLFQGDEILNVSDDMIIGIDVDKELLATGDSEAVLYLYGCKNVDSDECKVSEKARVYAEKGITKATVLALIEADKQSDVKEDKPSVTEVVKPAKTKANNNGPKVGTKISDKKFTYKVTKAGRKDGKKIGEVTVVSLKNKKAKKATIKSTVKINGVKYKVTSISKKAFSKCKKLKKINIKTKNLKKIAKGAFKGVKKNCVIKVPKAKKKAYKKLIKKAGFKGKVK